MRTRKKKEHFFLVVEFSMMDTWRKVFKISGIFYQVLIRSNPGPFVRDINAQNQTSSICFIFGGLRANGVIHFSFQGFCLTPNIKKVRAISKSRKFNRFSEIGYINRRRALRAISAASERIRYRKSGITACLDRSKQHKT